jgi:hypothetical protein
MTPDPSQEDFRPWPVRGSTLDTIGTVGLVLLGALVSGMATGVHLWFLRWWLT